MIVTRLKLANLRAIETAEFHFQPGVNLIVGVNGVGKTTVLQAISRGLAHAIAVAEGVRTTPPNFTERDIRLNSEASNVTLDIEVGGLPLQVVEDFTTSAIIFARPGELASGVDVHAKDVRRRGRLRQAQREALTTSVHERGPRFLPDKASFQSNARRERTRMLAIFFSTTRAVAARRTARVRRAVRPDVGAFSEAFVGRELGLGAFAEWLRVLSATAHEREDARPILRALDEAVRRFLPGYLGLRVTEDSPPRLLIDRTQRGTVRADQLAQSARQRLVQVLRRMRAHMDLNWPPKDLKGLSAERLAKAAAAERRRVVASLLKADMPGVEAVRGPFEEVPAEVSDTGYFDEFFRTLGRGFELDQQPEALDVAQLSDGERGSLALVLDLTRRFAQANPELFDPAAQAEAVVLIDEMELHLHPSWQRTIMTSLAATFPNCQFIGTTHSPQVVGEVERDRVHVLTSSGTEIASVARGADANWLLDHVMGGASETRQSMTLAGEIDRAIAKSDLQTARHKLRELRTFVDGETGEIARLEASIASLELLKAEPGTEAR
jgi:predicted ATP-binding protein involved in virulence